MRGPTTGRCCRPRSGHGLWASSLDVSYGGMEQAGVVVILDPVPDPKMLSYCLTCGTQRRVLGSSRADDMA